MLANDAPKRGSVPGVARDGNVARVVAQVLVDGHSHQVAAGRDAYAELLCCRAAAQEVLVAGLTRQAEG